jgi:hypothetical protein
LTWADRWRTSTSWLFLKVTSTQNSAASAFGFRTSTVAYGAFLLAQLSSFAIPSARESLVPPVGVEVGVERCAHETVPRMCMPAS